MTLWWIGNIALVAVFLVVYLLHGVLSAARSIVPSVEESRRRRQRARRTSTPHCS